MISKLFLVVKDVFRVHGSRLWWLMLLMVIVALGEGLTMTLLLPLLSVLGIDGNNSSGAIQTFVDQALAFFGVGDSVFGILGLIIVAFAIQTAMYIGQTWWVSSLQRRYGAYWQ